MNRQECAALFDTLYPGFFETERIRNLPEDRIYDEMILSLQEVGDATYPEPPDPGATFGEYAGDLGMLRELVAKVNPGWAPKYTEDRRIYCGFLEDRPVSFCLIEEFGTHRFGGRSVKIGGPGCVGTLKEYRRRGIGLAMVKKVTELLREEGYAYSYIHYTGLEAWYGKLGYRTVLRWNCRGLL